MTITVNGESNDSGAADVAGLLDELGLTGVPVLVEHNGTALYPRDFPTTELNDADKVEIIRVVAGG